MQLTPFSGYNPDLISNYKWIVPALLAPILLGAEAPYFVTYSHQMEEPGSLEMAFSNVVGRPEGGNRFLGSLAELEYGVRTWWTTEVYLSGQSTQRESAFFTGYRWENRIRPLLGEHWINPVLYVEYASLNGADKTLKEIVGHDSRFDALAPNDEGRLERKHELETKLILSSNLRGWNISGNFIAEKNLAHQPWEFGYAMGVSRPLSLKASASECNLCRENFYPGLEVYGGLGTWRQFGLRDTSHYLAPSLSWQLGNGTTFRISPGFGVTGNSHGFLLRFGVSYEIAGAGRRVRQWFRGDR